MEVSLLGVIVSLAIVTWVGMVTSVVMFLRVRGIWNAVKIPGMPRIWFLSLVTLKAWVSFFVGVAVASTFLGGIPSAIRGWLNLCISIMAASQAVGVCVAVYRDQRGVGVMAIPGRNSSPRFTVQQAVDQAQVRQDSADAGKD